jgi:hypothetical protein
MSRRRSGVHAAAVAVAAAASMVIATLTATLTSTVPAGATGAGSVPAASAHKTTRPPRRGVPKMTTACGVVVTRPPVSIPPISTVPIFTPGPPATPGLCPLQASEYDVVVGWYARSDNATSFVVYRLDGQGNPQEVFEIPAYTEAGGGEPYSWTDTDTDQSGQCYKIAAVNSDGTTDSPVECTVRPDAFQFPPADGIQPGSTQWSGLSGDNDGTGPLENAEHGSTNNLIWQVNKRSIFPFHCGCGVDLAFTNKTSLWKVQATGGPNIMYGEAVALRVWGGGWLEYAHQTFGVDLHLVSTPVYQWYILGGTPGDTVDSSEFALWDSAASDFLVEHGQTFGPDLEWYKKTLPPTTPPPPAPVGVRLLVEYNCSMDGLPVEMWVDDSTAGTGWSDRGTVPNGWVDGDGCEETSDNSWGFTPISGHRYEVRAVDFEADGCSNDPTISSCDIADVSFVGDANGIVDSIPIG